MEKKPVSINFCFDVENQYFFDQLKVIVNSFDIYINNIDFSDFAFSDFLNLLGEIYDTYKGQTNFKISLSDDAGL